MLTLLEEVREEGREEGREEVRKEGREEGRKEVIGTAIIRRLKNRFRKITKTMEQEIRSIRSYPDLEKLLDMAYEVQTIREFSVELKKVKGTTE